AGMSEHFFPGGLTSLDLAMIKRLANGHDSQQIINLDFHASAAISVVIFMDRYGRLTFQAFGDARD
ncbi:MAG: hypothetical protein ACREP1_11360, partial [Rhodanobacteraceae bacterium]